MATNKLFLKRPHEAGRIQMNVEDVASMTIEQLKEKVATILSLSGREFRLVYAGRVLKTGKTTGHYKISSGCTVYVLKAPPSKKKVNISEDRGQAAGSSLLNNRRVLRAICRILSNPGLLRSMIQGTQLANNEALIRALGNRQLIAELSNPDSLQEYLQTYPQMALMMENIIRVYGLLYGGLTGDTVEEEQEIIDMVERNFEDDLEDADQEESSPLAQAQEQMFEHSQALHAHQQQRQTQAGQAAASNLSTSRRAVAQESSVSSEPPPIYRRQHSAGGSITQQQLASALAGALGSASSSSSAPSSLTQGQILQPPPAGPSHPHPAVTSSVTTTSTTAPSPSARRGHSSGSSSSTRRVQPGHSSASRHSGATNQRSGRVTGDVLQQALANAFSSIQTPSRAAQDNGDNLTPRQRYAAHLIQLHAMGITDDAACLQALEATGGDLEAALEILYSK